MKAIIPEETLDMKFLLSHASLAEWYTQYKEQCQWKPTNSCLFENKFHSKKLSIQKNHKYR
jgi:hypothetical protein